MEISLEEYQDLMQMKSIVENIINKNYNSATEKKQTYFSDYYEKWLLNQKSKVQVNTYYIYKCNSRKIIQYFKDKELCIESLTVDDIESFYTFLSQEGLSANTIRRHHANIHKCLQCALKDKLIGSNPASFADLPAKETYNANFMSVEQLNNMIQIFKNTEFFTPILICALMGLRRSEVLGLKWSCMDFKNSKMVIKHKVVEANIGDRSLYFYDKMKNKTSHRTLKIPHKLLAYLYVLKNEQDFRKKGKDKNYNKKYEEYICVLKNGELMKPSWLSRNFAKTMKENNLGYYRLHDLRHSCASILHLLGYSLKDISKYLGHCDVQMTGNVYTHVFEEMENKMAEDINNIIQI